jgi:hypothetical protein
MLINFTNHTSSEWAEDQLKASAVYGQIIDIPFPYIDPEWDESVINSMAAGYAGKCIEMTNSDIKDSAVHIMGEMTFCYSVIKKLREAEIKCLASTTKREVTAEGSLKLTEFRFVRFREYC